MKETAALHYRSISPPNDLHDCLPRVECVPLRRNLLIKAVLVIHVRIKCTICEPNFVREYGQALVHLRVVAADKLSSQSLSDLHGQASLASSCHACDDKCFEAALQHFS